MNNKLCIKCFLCGNHHTKCFTCMISFNPHNTPIYIWRIWDSEALGNLTKWHSSWGAHQIDFIWSWCLFIQMSYLKASSLLHWKLCWGSGNASCRQVQRRPRWSKSLSLSVGEESCWHWWLPLVSWGDEEEKAGVSWAYCTLLATWSSFLCLTGGRVLAGEGEHITLNCTSYL